MKTRPILFSAPMVRAILDGSKTQTRRVIKPQPEWTEPESVWQHGDGHSGTGWYVSNSDYPEEGALFYRCPYGQVGDRLWVRENFQPFFNDDCDGDMRLANWKTGENYHCSYPATDGVHEFMDQEDNLKSSVKPSIHMPRWASRITLEITGVRVERLQEISEDDAIAEGVKNSLHLPGGRFARENYEHLWWAINGDGSWELNPWVWVIEFKAVKP